MANYFDQFDPPKPQPNFFDQFDPPPGADPWAAFPVVDPASGSDPWAAFPAVDPNPAAAPAPAPAPVVPQYNDLAVPGSMRPDGTIVPGAGVEGTVVNAAPTSAYDRFRSSDNLVDSIMAAGDYGLELAGYTAEGARKGAGNVLGLPVDLINAAPMLANVIPGVSGVGPISNKPVGGSDMLGDVLDGYGLVPTLPETADPLKKGFARVGEEIGAASVPMLGTLGATARMTAAEARNLPGVLKKLFNADKAAVDPAKFVADELRIATGAGTGAAALNEITNNDRSTAGGALVDAGGATGGAIVTGVSTALIKALGNVGTAVFNPAKYVDDGVKSDVVDIIMGNSGYRAKSGEVDDTAPLVNSIMNGPKVGDTVPGFQESLADRTKNPGIAALEYAQQSGPNAGMYNAQRATNTAAVDSALQPFDPGGTPGAYADAAIAERNRRLADAAGQASTATRSWENATRTLIPALTGEGRGANIRTALQDASEQARAVLQQAWAPINGSTENVDMQALDAIFRGTDSKLSVAEMRRFRPSEAGIPGEFIDPGTPETPTGILDAKGKPIMKAAIPPSGEAPLNEITGIRSALTDAAREATTAGKVNEARIIGQYIDGIDNYMQTNLPDDLRQQYDAARAATVDFNDRFTRPQTAIGQTLAETQGQPRLPDSAITKKFVQGDQGRIADFEALMREAGNDDRVQEAVRDQILQDVRDRGLLENPQALNDYLENYGTVFQRFPGLRRELGSAGALRTQMDTAVAGEQQLRDTLTRQGQSAVANYLQYGNENADRAMRSVIGAKDPRAAIDELLSFVNDAPAAVNGARKTFWNIMQKDARSGGRTTGDINGAQPWSPYSLNKFLDDPVNSAVLDRLYRADPDHLKNIRQIAKAIQGTEVRSGARVANTSGTAQGVNNVLTPETIQSRLYAYKSGKISLSFFLTAMIAVLARRSVSAARDKALPRILDDALLNPEVAAGLLKENNPANRKAMSRWAKTWFGNEASSIINAMSADDENTETTAIMEGR